MASKESTQSFVLLKRTKFSCMAVMRILFIACIHVAQSNKQGKSYLVSEMFVNFDLRCY